MRKRREVATDAMGPGLDLIVSLFAIVAVLYALAVHRGAEKQQDLTSQLRTRQVEFQKNQTALDAAQSARDALTSENQGLQDRLDSLAEEKRQLDLDKQQIRRELKQASARVIQLGSDLRQVRKQEGEFRKQLVGLNGDLDHVVVVVDRSTSMKRDNRWERTQATVKRWLTYLPVKRAAIIVYGNDVQRFPATGYADFESGGDAGRQALIDQFLEIEPGGGTSTKAALAAAVQYPDVDTIILFSDGQPTDGTTDEIVAEVGKIYRERTAKFNVNTIAVGVYFDKKSVEFLENLAEATAGSYRAE